MRINGILNWIVWDTFWQSAIASWKIHHTCIFFSGKATNYNWRIFQCLVGLPEGSTAMNVWVEHQDLYDNALLQNLIVFNTKYGDHFDIMTIQKWSLIDGWLVTSHDIIYTYIIYKSILLYYIIHNATHIYLLYIMYIYIYTRK